ncbi:FAD-dependent monooxygenase [Paenibacillus sp. UNC499MF]|uniref:FAD-dependent monooxygenase n=1 Tax=Paenibacillus sp. UNC499MF TaxID=1502751 RepID=UPI00089F92F3|nr:FAD-dependent monooxygenase [Paenibacillus sp. UNC499MF]SEG47454.1 2-polyprenyl-6-methoxyphenol hydroxylase [Paenibacillus sp. UNC499MF]
MEQVLIAGAGPTGLMLALQLAHYGVPFRIIDKNEGPGQASRAMAVTSRTLEYYQQLGLAEEMVSRGIKVDRGHIWTGTKRKGTLPFGMLGEGLSPFPFVFTFPQDDHERLLIEALKAESAEVEWNTELVSFVQKDGTVEAVLNHSGREEMHTFRYLCGCDGAHSRVRKSMDNPFEGEKYEQDFYVADLHGEGGMFSGRNVGINFGDEEFALVFPVRSSGTYRLIGVVPPAFRDREPLSFEDMYPYLHRNLGLGTAEVKWFSKYHVHHRVARHFREGTVFMAGDAGHIHSPAGGQGMNTGIGDAVNLGWKLAAVIQKRAAPSLLDTYEAERLPFAKLLVDTTDRAFKAVISTSRISRLVKKHLFPYAGPFLFRRPAIRRRLYSLISQIRITYRGGELAAGEAGTLQGGDRLPYAEVNFSPLRSMDWQLHVYGRAGRPLRDAGKELRLPLHEFPWNRETEKAGFTEDALYLVRPDGHIGFVNTGQDTALLRAYVAKHEIVPVSGTS